jgi:hypothetical protein
MAWSAARDLERIAPGERLLKLAIKLFLEAFSLQPLTRVLFRHGVGSSGEVQTSGADQEVPSASAIPSRGEWSC